MRRKGSPEDKVPREYTPSRADQELAALVGHMTFLWNYIENALDWTLDQAIEAPPALRVDVRSRINGLDGKLAIIKKCVGLPSKFSDGERTLVLNTLGCFDELKRARDAVTHVRIGNAERDVAPSFERQGDIYEALVSKDAITTLNMHLEH